MRKLEILEPNSVDEALQMLVELGDDAKILAGGTAVVLMYSQRLIAPTHLISLGQIEDLDYIRHEPGIGLRIGALTTHRTVECSSLVRDKYPIVADTFHQVANVRVRNQATVGGVLAEADYASDPPSVLIALGALVKVAGIDGIRTIPVSDLITGYYETDLRPGEVILEVIIPDLAENYGASYIKYVTRSSEDRPCVGVAAIVEFGKDRVCEELRIVVGAVAEIPQEFSNICSIAKGERITSNVARKIGVDYAGEIDPISDMRGSGWYRKELIQVLVERAILQASG